VASPHAAHLPPGPGLLGAIQFARRPFEFLDDCARRFGDWFTLRVPGVPPFVFTSDPEAIRAVFAGDPEIFRAGEANAPLGAFMGPQSVLFLDGAAHLRQRRLLLPSFHGERMHAYGRIMRAAAERIIDTWPIDHPFPLHASMQAITFDVILRAVFGFDEGAARTQLERALGRLFRYFGNPLASLLGLPALRLDLGPLSPWGRVVRLKRAVESVLVAEFARRRAAGTDGRTDVLSLLMSAEDEHGQRLSDAALRDEMLTLLLAGHETTAASLSWVAHRLIERPALRDRLRAELATVGGRPERVSELPLLDAVIKETSRLHPVIPNVGRRLGATTAIAGRALPAGAVVAPCIYLAHRRPDLWPESERFDPDRFSAARAPMTAFFPFGGGVRRCIGAAFASFEMKIVLATMLERVDLAPLPGYRATPVRRSIAFTPSEGLPVIATRRG